MESEIPQWVYNAAGEIEAAQDGDEGQSHYPIYHQQIAEIFMKHMKREQPQGEATPRPEDVATSPSEQCTFHYPLPIQFKDHIEVLQCILKRGHSGKHRAATGETWRGSWEGQAQTEGGEKPPINNAPYGMSDTTDWPRTDPASPPSRPAGGARELRDKAFTISYHSTSYYCGYKVSIPNYAGGEVVTLADAEAYAAEQVRHERKRYANALVDPLSLWEIFR